MGVLDYRAGDRCPDCDVRGALTLAADVVVCGECGFAPLTIAEQMGAPA